VVFGVRPRVSGGWTEDVTSGRRGTGGLGRHGRAKLERRSEATSPSSHTSGEHGGTIPRWSLCELRGNRAAPIRSERSLKKGPPRERPSSTDLRFGRSDHPGRLRCKAHATPGEIAVSRSGSVRFGPEYDTSRTGHPTHGTRSWHSGCRRLRQKHRV
jgi:hypothetical protein